MAPTIGTLAASTGCAVDTIRYHERAGLLTPPARSPAGHRQYAPGDRKHLLVIRRACQLGFNLGEIRDLLALTDRRGIDCAPVRGVAALCLEGLERQIRELPEWRGARSLG